MRFQCKLSHLNAVFVNGKTFHVDSDGCIDVDVTEDIAKFKSLAREWVPVVGDVVARTVATAVAGPAGAAIVRGAEDFVLAFATDPALRERLGKIRSPAYYRSAVEALGYRFTPEEVTKATDDLLAQQPELTALFRPEQPAAAVESTPVAGVDEPKKKTRKPLRAAAE